MSKVQNRETAEEDNRGGRKQQTLADEIGEAYGGHSFTIWDSLRVYLSSFRDQRKEYERKLLNHLPLFQGEGQHVYGREVEVLDVEVSGSYIHEVCIRNTEVSCDGDKLDIVLVHGYGAALGFFYKNIEALSSIGGSSLHLVDMLGFGCSGRPAFPIEDCRNDMDRVLRAESFFVGSFEEWRRKRGVTKCVVIAHSLGGYLMSAYYLKFGREVVEKLILVSPVGVEDSEASLFRKYKCGYGGEDGDDSDDCDPFEYNVDKDYRIAKEQGVDLSKELTDHLHEQEWGVKDYDDEDDGDGEDKIEDDDGVSLMSVITHDGDAVDDTEMRRTRVEQVMRQLKTRVVPGKILTRLWERHYTPMDIVRLFGPLSGSVVAIWVYNRFQRVHSEPELFDLCNYTTSLFLSRGAGEYALGSLLAPGSLARLPLCERLPSQIRVPVLLLYGEEDWMDKMAGYKLAQDINTYGGQAKYRVVRNGGHHLYVDNPDEFAKQVVQFIRERGSLE